MASTENDILNAVHTVISGLSFTTDPEEIAIRKWPYDKGRSAEHWYPGITISRVKEYEQVGTNSRDDIGYGVLITMIVDNSADPTEDDLFAEWRQTIRKAFIHQRLAGITSCQTCLVEPGPVYRDVPENYDVSALVIRVISREART